jgi:hypothetical protein
LKWGLLSDKRRGLIITGHSPSTGGGNAPQNIRKTIFQVEGEGNKYWS